jgi:hypothetical protein
MGTYNSCARKAKTITLEEPTKNHSAAAKKISRGELTTKI